MNFSTFLLESDYKKKIDKDTAIKLIKDNCDTKKILYRGMTNTGTFLKVNGADGHRESANTSNYYTVILDKFIKDKGKDLPLRSKSIICTDDHYTATQFGGEVYIILPYKTTILGKVNASDIWATKVKIGNVNLPIEYWNDMYNDTDIDVSSYESIIKSLEKLLNDDLVDDKDYTEDDLAYSDATEYLYLAFDFDAKNVSPYIEKAYNIDTLGFKFVTADKNKIGRTSSEYWIGGDCIAITESAWDKIKDEL